MALSMDEQRVLAEIERRLAAEDPGLAACMTAFRRPGPAAVLRSPRARIIGSLFTVLLVALISLMVYAMIPFRGHGQRPPAPSTAASLSTASTHAAGNAPAQTTGPSANTGIKPGGSAKPMASSPGTASSGQRNSARTASQSSTASGPLPAAVQDSRQSWTRYRSSPSSFLFSCWNSSLSGLRCRSKSSA